MRKLPRKTENENNSYYLPSMSAFAKQYNWESDGVESAIRGTKSIVVFLVVEDDNNKIEDNNDDVNDNNNLDDDDDDNSLSTIKNYKSLTFLHKFQKVKPKITILPFFQNFHSNLLLF